MLVSKPVLHYPTLGKPFTLHTDASGVGVGAVLEQEDAAGNLRPVGYFSRNLTGPQLNYGITEREALAVVLALDHFRVYLLGVPVTLMVDHSALGYIEKLHKQLDVFTGKFER